MLKITFDDKQSDIVKVNLCGQFTREYVPEVEKALVPNSDKTKKYALALTNVTFVDRVAMEFLRAIKSRGVRIESLPSYVTRWIQQDATKDSSKFKPSKE